MANMKKVNGATVQEAILLTEIDFTALDSDDWIGESSVSLDGRTWDILNSSNANTLGPNGSTLVLHPKGTGVCDWYASNRTSPGLAIDLSDLDPRLDDSARYAVQIITPGFQSVVQQYARLLLGFYNTASTARGYGPVFGLQYHSGANKLYWIQGSNNEASTSTGFTGSEQTFWVHLESNGLWTCYTSDAQDTTVGGGTKRGTVWASIPSVNVHGVGADISTGLLTKPSTARVVLTACGYNGVSTGPTLNIDSLRVWRVSSD